MVFSMTKKYVMDKSGIVNLINLCCSLEWKDKDLFNKREFREMAKQDYNELTESLSTLQKRVEGLEKIKDISKKIYDASESGGRYGDGSYSVFLDDNYDNSALLVELGELLEKVE